MSGSKKYDELLEIIKTDCDSFEASIEYLNKCIKEAPNFFEAYLIRGEAYEEMGNFQKALDDFEKSIKINPNEATAYNNRGRIYVKSGDDNNKALKDFNKAIKLNTTFADAYSNRANVYLKMREPQKAISDCTKAIEISPNENAEPYFNRGLAYMNLEEQKLDKALADYNKVIEIAPDNAEAYAKRGLINQQFNNTQEAINDFQEFLRLDPNNKNAGLVRDELKQLKSSKISFSNKSAETVSIKNDSTKLDNLYKVARRAKEDDNVDQAFIYYDQICTEDTDSWEASFYSGYFQAKQAYRKTKELSNLGTIEGAIELAFDLIEKIQDYNELKSACGEISKKINSLAASLIEDVKIEYRENIRYVDNIEAWTITKLSMKSSYRKARDIGLEMVEHTRNFLKQRLERIDGEVTERRLKEYWDAHQPEKTALESEKQSLTKQIGSFYEEISTLPGQIEINNFNQQVEKLVSEKKAIGLFKFKEKKPIKMQINSIKKEIEKVRIRISPAVEEIKKRISRHESRISAIDIELTKPR